MIAHTGRSLTLVLAFAFVPLLGACGGGDDEVDDVPAGDVTTTQTARVTDVNLGRSIGTDRRVTAATTDFGRNDTIYASVATTGGAAKTTLTARWTFEDGQVVEESSQSVSSSGASVTEFHISQPGGLPPGEYQVEISLNGQVVETEEFEVR